MLAIGIAEGKQNGYRMVRIVSSPLGECEGIAFCTQQILTEGKPYLVQFSPQDQFCNAISINRLNNVDLTKEEN